jgi:hypothetical protein
MLALHGRGWRTERGRRGRHAAITAAALATALFGASGHRRLAAVAAAGWLLGTAEFAVARIASGPRTPREVTSMVVTSALIPPAAVGYWMHGRLTHRPGRTNRWPVTGWSSRAARVGGTSVA